MENTKKNYNGGRDWEYLFRGFCGSDKGEEKAFVGGEWIRGSWVYGNLRKQADDIWEIGERRKGASWMQVIPETVGMQCEDNSGLGIRGEGAFRGDVIQNPDEEEFPGDVVEYNEQVGFFRSGSKSVRSYAHGHAGKVVGNRWSNPELIEAGESKWDWEYLFRGFCESCEGDRWAFINGEWIQGFWIYGNLQKDRKGSCAIEERNNLGKFIPVFSETVGLCAEVRDEKGQPICDGDIAKIYGEEIVYIQYYGSTHCHDGDGGPMPIGCAGSCEVIGNKWERPELLLDREKTLVILEYESKGEDIVSALRDKTEKLREMKAAAEKQDKTHKKQRRWSVFVGMAAGLMLGGLISFI